MMAGVQAISRMEEDHSHEEDDNHQDPSSHVRHILLQQKYC